LYWRNDSPFGDDALAIIRFWRIEHDHEIRHWAIRLRRVSVNERVFSEVWMRGNAEQASFIITRRERHETALHIQQWRVRLHAICDEVNQANLIVNKHASAIVIRHGDPQRRN